MYADAVAANAELGDQQRMDDVIASFEARIAAYKDMPSESSHRAAEGAAIVDELSALWKELRARNTDPNLPPITLAERVARIEQHLGLSV